MNPSDFTFTVKTGRRRHVTLTFNEEDVMAVGEEEELKELLSNENFYIEKEGDSFWEFSSWDNFEEVIEKLKRLGFNFEE